MGFDFRKWELGANAGRVFGTFGNPTLLAGFLAATLPIGIGKIVAQISTDKKLTDGRRYLRSSVYLFVTAIMLLALFLTFSRGAYIAAAVSTVMMVVLYRRVRPNEPAWDGSCRSK